METDCLENRQFWFSHPAVSVPTALHEYFTFFKQVPDNYVLSGEWRRTRVKLPTLNVEAFPEWENNFLYVSERFYM